MENIALVQSMYASDHYNDTGIHDHGCVALWRAVIELVVYDFISYSKYRNSRCRDDVHQQKEAEELIFGSHKSHFDDLCVFACIDPDYVRRKAKEELYQK